MQISKVSSTMHNPSSGNTGSNSTLNLLRKQKAEIQEQIKDVEKSKLPTKVKQEKIKILEEQSLEIDKQITEEQSKQLTNDIKNTEAKNTQQETATEEDESPQVLNKNVMTGIISASKHVEKGKVAMSVYNKAKAEGDVGKMNRALSYATPEFKKASQSTKLIGKGLQEYKNQTNKINKADQPAETAATSDVQEDSANEAGVSAENSSVHSKDKSNNNVDTTLTSKPAKLTPNKQIDLMV